ncbi:MAG: hypothetical protein JSS27_10450 [Planctomycetes bacterium]|nr:hypothetical protein [Planctomycetota bacterium]
MVIVVTKIAAKVIAVDPVMAIMAAGHMARLPRIIAITIATARKIANTGRAAASRAAPRTATVIMAAAPVRRRSPITAVTTGLDIMVGLPTATTAAATVNGVAKKRADIIARPRVDIMVHR